MMFVLPSVRAPVTGAPTSRNAVLPPQDAWADPRQRPAPPSSVTVLSALPVSEPRLNVVRRFVSIRVAGGRGSSVVAGAVPRPTTLNPSHGSSASSPLKSPKVLSAEVSSWLPRKVRLRVRWSRQRAVEGRTDTPSAAKKRLEMEGSCGCRWWPATHYAEKFPTDLFGPGRRPAEVDVIAGSAVGLHVPVGGGVIQSSFKPGRS